MGRSQLPVQGDGGGTPSECLPRGPVKGADDQPEPLAGQEVVQCQPAPCHAFILEVMKS